MYQEYIDTAAALIDTCKIDDVTRDVAIVQEKLDQTKLRWTKIIELADERKQQTQEAQKLVKKFQSIISPYEDTHRSCDKRSKKPRELGSEPEALENYMNKLQVITLSILDSSIHSILLRTILLSLLMRKRTLNPLSLSSKEVFV